MWIPDLADPDRMAALLTAHAAELGLPDGPLRLVDARLTNPHRPESPRCSGWALYAVARPGDPGRPAALWYLKAYPGGSGAHAWAVHRAAHPGSAGRYLPALDLLAWPFPADPALPVLAELVDPGLAVRHLPAAVPGGGAPATVGVEVVRYQPEASAVLRLRVTGRSGGPPQQVYAKVMAAGDVPALAATQARLWDRGRTGGPLRVAEPLGHDQANQILWTREVAGQPLAAVLASAGPATLDRLADAVAALLADLHASDAAPTGPVVELPGLAEEARKKGAKLASAHPAVADRLTGVAAGTELLRDRPPGRRSVHADCHVDQLLSTGDGLALLDLDSVTTGPPELDLAEFVVDLALRGSFGGVADRFVPRLLAAYDARSGTPLDPTVLRALADAEFLNRCYRHLRHHSPGWRGLLEHELAGHRRVTALLRSRRSAGREAVED